MTQELTEERDRLRARLAELDAQLGRPPLTIEDVREMSRREVMSRLPEVDEALAAGRHRQADPAA